jgi:uncharacterized protein (TIGR02598 family)
MDKLTNKSGFTLVETVIAIAVFAIAIIALYGLVTLSIKGNATAITVTTAANWAQDRVEVLLAKDYDHSDLDDGVGQHDDCDGLDDYPGLNNWKSDHMDNDDANYTIYWNVANDCTLTAVPDTQRPKHIRVIVTRKGWAANKKVVLNYIKQI